MGDNREPQTGGTLRVSGNIRFSFDVQSSDCNVFTLTELREQIESDPIGWFIDYCLGSPVNSESDERYEVVSFDVRPVSETAQVDMEIKVIEKYLVLDPDEVAPDDARQPMDPDDTVFP